jgi:hypothetical protein
MAAAAKRANQRGRIISRWSRRTKGASKAWIQRTKGALVKHKVSSLVPKGCARYLVYIQ